LSGFERGGLFQVLFEASSGKVRTQEVAKLA